MQGRRIVPARDSRTAFRSHGGSAISVLILAVALCGCRARSVPVGPPALIFRTVPIGLCEDYPEESRSMDEVRRDLALLRDAGVRMLRVSIGWDGLEPSQGHYDWTFWDAFVDLMARKQGIRLIPYVAYTPRWISTGGADDYWKSPPRDVAAFERTMAILAERYRDTISSWEIWNEPDNRDYWLGSAAEFARLLEAGARGVRRGNPHARVVLGGLAGHVDFLAQLMRTTAGAAVDVVNAHAYPETWSPQSIESLPRYVQQIADASSDSARAIARAPSIWMAEVGYSEFRNGSRVSGDVFARYAYEHTRAFQAVAQLRMLALLLGSPAVDLVAWYELKDPPPGAPMIGDDNNRHLGVATAAYVPKPSLSSLRFFVDRTRMGVAVVPVTVRPSGPRPVSEGTAPPDSPVVARAFDTPDGQVTIFAWIPTRDPGNVSAIDPRGDEVDPRRARVDLEIPLATSGDAVMLDPSGTALGSRPVEHRSDSTAVNGIDLRGGAIGLLTLRAR
jgi:polysaccharide biosynthesis protein PslG